MIRWYVFKDNEEIASCATREEALRVVRIYQQQETWYFKSEYFIMSGIMEPVPYEQKAEEQ